MEYEKTKYKITSLSAPKTFTFDETVRNVVEKCVLAPANRLICLNENG